MKLVIRVGLHVPQKCDACTLRVCERGGMCWRSLHISCQDWFGEGYSLEIHNTSFPSLQEQHDELFEKLPATNIIISSVPVRLSASELYYLVI